MKTTLILSRSQVEGLVTMGEVVAEVETIFADLSKGTALQPGALSMSLPSGSGAFVVMPALADRQNLALLKLLADVPDNVEKGLPMQRSVITLVAKDTGAPVAIFHGQIPTRIRTAAASAVASRHLSRPDSRILGLIGAGALALEHIRSHLVVRPIGRVLVWSRKDATVSNLIALAAQEFPDLVVEAAASKQEVFARSDIVCTLTPSRDPVVEGLGSNPASTSMRSVRRRAGITARSTRRGWRGRGSCSIACRLPCMIPAIFFWRLPTGRWTGTRPLPSSAISLPARRRGGPRRKRSRFSTRWGWPFRTSRFAPLWWRAPVPKA
ncbi:hypothetical protein QWZ10_05915 [Paracoccus cavernae]|uniref:Ornithine cyclodeaminase family protein n=1 Tax=Paracoccus cavernae TaxID=1571207 RepID=A0ABT8D4L2_9RHOB|nr:hypothetical protein [Paracoccus cavernae]